MYLQKTPEIHSKNLSNIFANILFPSRMHVDYSRRELGEIMKIHEVDKVIDSKWNFFELLKKTFFLNILGIITTIILGSFILFFQGCSCPTCQPKIIEKKVYIEKKCPKLQAIYPEEIGIKRNNSEIELNYTVKPAKTK